MGYFSELDIEVRDMVAAGVCREALAQNYPELTETELDRYMADDHDGDEDEDDGQPSMYEEYQDLYGGDDWDHGQYDSEF